MKLIRRYVYWELLSAFTLTLTAVTSMIILILVASSGVNEGLGWGSILRIVPYTIPSAFQFSLPATILLAASSVYGRMSADNEIVAIKSMGITPTAVITPAFVLAFLVSLVAVWTNDLASSWGRMGLYRVIVESVEEVAYRKLRMQRSYHSPTFSINVKDVIGRKLIQPSIQMQGGNGNVVRIDGSVAELKSDAERNTLTIHIWDLRIDQGGTQLASNEESFDVSLDTMTRKGDVRESPSVVPLWQIQRVTRTQRETTEQLERNGATAAAFQLMTGEFRQLSDQGEWQRREKLIEGARTRLHRLNLEPWRRWAAGFSCLFFVMIGAPLAISMKTANFFTTFGACFLPILLLYYPLLMFAISRCKDGAMPPYTVWLGNLVLCLVGAWMTRRVVRY